MSPRKSSVLLYLCIAAGLLFYLFLAIRSAAILSPTQDEPLHIAAGHSYWQENDFRMQPENGILGQRWIGLGTILQAGVEPIRTETEIWEQGRQWFVAYDFLRENRERALFASRIMIVLSGMALLLGVFLVSKTLWGTGGATVSVVLAALSPTVLASSTLATSDLILALTFFLGAVSLARLVYRPTVVGILLAGLACGAAAISKYTAIVLLPYSLILLILLGVQERKRGKSVRRVARSIGALLAAALVAYVVIWSAYGFRYSTFSPNLDSGGYNQPLEEIQTDTMPSHLLAKMREYRIFPEPYLYGAELAYTYSRSRAAFFLGETGPGNWRMYFPVAFLAKSGPVVLALLVASLVFAFSGRMKGSFSALDERKRFLFRGMISAGLLFFVFCVFSRLNIGHRHMLPVYPFLFVWLGSVWPMCASKADRSVVGVALGIHGALAIWIAPAFLSYINPFFGGPGNGHKLFADSSFDWGQEMYVLADWLDDHETKEPPMLALFAPMEPSYYGIDGEVIFQFGAGFPMNANVPELREGLLAVSSTILSGPYFLTRADGWSEADERNYWISRGAVEEVVQAAGQDPAAWVSYLESRPEISWKKIFSAYSRLRIKRFLALISQKEPLARPSDTIFIWEVTRAELADSGFENEPVIPDKIELPLLLRDRSVRRQDL